MFNLRDIKAFIGSIDTKAKDPKTTQAVATLAGKTVAQVKSMVLVNESHEIDIITSAVTDSIMLATFDHMPKEQKVLLLNAALQSSEKQIAALEQKHRFTKELNFLALREWVIKFITIGIFSIGLFASFFFISTY